MFPENKGWLSITSICIPLDFLTVQILCDLKNSSSIKHAHAPQSNNTWQSCFVTPNRRSIVKQWEALAEDTKYFLVCDNEESSHTIFIMARRPRFPTML